MKNWGKLLKLLPLCRLKPEIRPLMKLVSDFCLIQRPRSAKLGKDRAGGQHGKAGYLAENPLR